MIILRANLWSAHSNRFLYDGNRLNDDDTPALLDMDDGGTFVIFPPP